MNDALAVRRREALTDLDHQIELPFERRGLGTLQIVCEGPALEQLHGDERAAPIFAGVENRDDVRVDQARRGLRFAMEARQRIWIAFEVRHQDLEADEAAHDLVVRFVDDSHRTATDAPHDAVAANFFRMRFARTARFPFVSHGGRPHRRSGRRVPSRCRGSSQR